MADQYLSNADDSSNGPSLATQAPAIDPSTRPGPPTQPSGPQKPGLWGNVLRGALQGLAMGGVPGAVAGAIDPEQAHRNVANHRAMATAKVEQAQADVQNTLGEIKVKTAMAGNALAEAAVNNERAKNMPQEANDAHEAMQMSQLKDYHAMGVRMKVVADDNHDAVVGALVGITNTEGAVGHLRILSPGGGQHVAVDLDSLVDSPQGAVTVNQMNKVTGQPEVTPEVWSGTEKGARTQFEEKAAKFFAPDRPANTDQARADYEYYKGVTAAYAKSPNADPALVNKMTEITSRVKNIRDGMVTGKRSDDANKAYEDAHSAAKARQDVANEQASGFAYDPKTKQTIGGTLADLRSTPGLQMIRKVTEGEIKTNSDLSDRMGDVNNKINEYEQTMQTPISTQDRIQIARVAQDLHLDFKGVTIPTELLNAMLNTDTLKNLSPAGQDRLIAFRNARESMIGYQRVLSGSARSSEKAMELNLQALPAPTDPEQFGKRAIAAFKTNLKIIGKHIAITPGDVPPEQAGRPTPGQYDDLGAVPVNRR